MLPASFAFILVFPSSFLLHTPSSFAYLYFLLYLSTVLVFYYFVGMALVPTTITFDTSHPNSDCPPTQISYFVCSTSLDEGTSTPRRRFHLPPNLESSRPHPLHHVRCGSFNILLTSNPVEIRLHDLFTLGSVAENQHLCLVAKIFGESAFSTTVYN